MKTIRSFFPFLIIIVMMTSSVCIRKASIKEQGPDNGGIILAAGFSAKVVADNLGSGRHIAVNENGDIYLALREMNNNSGIVALRDGNKDGVAEAIEYFGTTISTGIEIKDGFLYYSTFSDVFRVPLSGNDLVPSGQPEVIATGFPEQEQHQDKTFVLDDDGNIYVNVGAPSNACQEQDRIPGSKGLDPCPQLKRQAGIWKFSANRREQDQVKDGYRYAAGIRNSIALAWNTANNKLYVVQHGRDQLHQFYPMLYTQQKGAELPAEEFLLVEDGDFFGWPYCYYDQIRRQKVLAPEYGGDTRAIGICSDAKDPILAFPGHLAPNDLLFYTGEMFPEKYRNGAFIAFHGSWNRAPLEQKGYFVAFVPFSNGLPSAEWETFADGFAGASPVMDLTAIKYRPCGLAQGPDGSLYISDSQEGRVWKVSYSSP